MNDSTASYIEYRNVDVQYTTLVRALRNVSLRIDKGEFVFFVGKTGAGKSTMLKLLSREARNTAGKVLLAGRDLSRLREREIPPLRREMGIIPQDFALLPRKRVWENVAYAMRAVGASRRDVRRRVPEILERVNIGHRADAYPSELSGGEQQRVAIARALINNPPLLLCDEPTGNLDPAHSLEIMDILKSLNLRGATVLVASHDVLVVEKMAKRVVTLDAGQIVDDTDRPLIRQPDRYDDIGFLEDPPSERQQALDFDAEPEILPRQHAPLAATEGVELTSEELDALSAIFEPEPGQEGSDRA